MQTAFQFSVELACKICRYSIFIIRGVILKNAKMIKTQNATTDFFLLNLTHPNDPVCIPQLQNNGRIRLMHVGAPSHTALATRALLQANRINVPLWPSLSPDLNPIEHVWDVIGQKVRSRVPLNIRDLERFVVEIKKLHCIYAEPLPSSCERQWRSHQISSSDDIVTLLITKCDE